MEGRVEMLIEPLYLVINAHLTVLRANVFKVCGIY